MPRKESRTSVEIWSDEEFTKLPRHAQHRYWQLFSQPNISLCGVVAYTPGRWGRQSADDGTEAILADLQTLVEHRYIAVDFDSEEIFVRSFMRNDHVWDNPKTRGAAIAVSKTVLSTVLRSAIEVEMARLEQKGEEKAGPQKP
jgi:hypothetical protein